MGQEFLHIRGRNLCHAAAKFSLGFLDSFMEPENGPVSLLNAYAVNLFSRFFIRFIEALPKRIDVNYHYLDICACSKIPHLI